MGRPECEKGREALETKATEAILSALLLENKSDFHMWNWNSKRHRGAFGDNFSSSMRDKVLVRVAEEK